MNDERLPKQLMEWQPSERRKRRCPKRSSNEGVMKGIGARSINEAQVHNRKKWRLGVVQRIKKVLNTIHIFY